MAGRAPHHTGRSAALFGTGDQDSPDAPGGVPVGAAPDRRPDWLDPSAPWSGFGGARSFDPQPSRRDPRGAKTNLTHRADASVGRQHRAAAVWVRRVADRE